VLVYCKKRFREHMCNNKFTFIYTCMNALTFIFLLHIIISNYKCMYSIYKIILMHILCIIMSKNKNKNDFFSFWFRSSNSRILSSARCLFRLFCWSVVSVAKCECFQPISILPLSCCVRLSLVWGIFCSFVCAGKR